MADKSVFKTVSSEKKKIFRIGGIIILIILAAMAAIFIAYKTSADKAKAKLENMDEYDKNIGPEECEDRGEWFNPVEYYSFYDGNGREGDVVGEMFQTEGERMGIVPAGVRLEPVIVTYEDFKPYDSLGQKGFMDDYACVSEPQEIESQLGVTADMTISGSYRTMQKDRFYGGEVNIDLSNIYYYMENTYDTQDDTVSGPEPGYYGYINPNFEFDYSLNGKAHITDDYPDYLGEITFEGEGQLDPSMWRYTSSMSGQDEDVFRMGAVYIRCQLPCKVHKTFEGKKETHDGFVNIYFKINEVRIGTRMDCMPEHALNKMRGIADESEEEAAEDENE